jgi:hypothetical protein
MQQKIDQAGPALCEIMSDLFAAPAAPSVPRKPSTRLRNGDATPDARHNPVDVLRRIHAHVRNDAETNTLDGTERTDGYSFAFVADSAERSLPNSS